MSSRSWPDLNTQSDVVNIWELMTCRADMRGWTKIQLVFWEFLTNNWRFFHLRNFNNNCILWFTWINYQMVIQLLILNYFVSTDEIFILRAYKRPNISSFFFYFNVLDVTCIVSVKVTIVSVSLAVWMFYLTAPNLTSFE